MAGSNYYGFTYAGTLTGPTYVPAAGNGYGAGMADAVQEAAYVSYPAAGAADGVAQYDYSQYQGISYPPYSQPQSTTAQSLGYSGYSASSTTTAAAAAAAATSHTSGYNNSYNQAVNEYAARTLYGSSSSNNTSSQAVYSSRETQWKPYNNNKNNNYGNNYGNNKVPRPEQSVYCDVCKISCVGEAAYRDHLKGKMHQRKKQVAEATSSAGITTPGVNPVMTYCQLCNVPCPGPQAYQAHMGGSKHKKVLMLHQRMGKAIPDMDPGWIQPVHERSPASAMATVVGTPTTTVSFVAGGSLHTVNSDQAGAAATATAATGTGEEGTEDATALALKSLDQVIAQAKSNSGHAGAKSTEVRPVEMPVSVTQRTPSPIGEEFVIDVPPKEGKPASFFCKLCQCPIGDRVARGQHVRGKRHRFAYKTNVDPSIEAETYPKIKPLPAAAASTANAGSPLETDNVSSPPAPRGPPNAPSSSYKSNRMTKALPMPKCNNNWNRREHCGLGWFTNPPRYVTHPPNPHHFAPRAPMSMNRPYGRMPMPPSYRMPGRYFAPSFPPQQPPMPMTGLRPRLPPPPPIPEPMHMQTLDTEEMEPELIYTNDDHLLMQKHSLICPTQREVDTIFHHLNVVEKALKLVSDDLMTPVTQETEEANKVEEKFNPDPSEVIEKGPVSSPSTGDKEDSQLQSVVNLGKKSSPVKSSADQAAASGSQDRILKGLIRVGPAAKELLLLGDDEAHIVVICSEKPTKALQDRVMDRLAHHLQMTKSGRSIKVFLDADGYTITVTDCGSDEDANVVTVRISLTSPLMRSLAPDQVDGETGQVSDCRDQNLLDRDHCLQALASVRRTKWYQARVADLDPAPVVIRVLRDLCRRDSSWSGLSPWSLMLLCERVTCSAGEPVTPSEALRHVLESVSGGILLPDAPGLIDPCEKDPVDALSYLTGQQRDDITLAAQRALRLMSFHELHLLLGMDVQVGGKKRKATEDPDPEPGDLMHQENFAEDEDFTNTCDTSIGMQQFAAD